jgi:hypothetical protein
MEKKFEKIRISKGNEKMGEIKSVSLPPIITCAKGCTCAKKCYAARFCNRRKNVREAYEKNLEILTNNPASYWEQVNDVVFLSRFFRFHVGGDIPNYEYLEKVVETAKNNPYCEILIFTKRYDFVNKMMDNGGQIPENLHLILSDWEGMEMPNPYNLPVSHVIFKGQNPEENWKICTGNCLECAKKGANCWTLKNGEHVAFHEH